MKMTFNCRTLHRSALLQTLALTLAVLGASQAQAKLNVVATMPDLAAIAHEVGGDDIDVQALISPKQDPHYADPRPSLVLALSRADLLVVNGLELESAWLAPLQTQARNDRILVGNPGYLDASVTVSREQVPTVRIERSQGDIHPGGNPHFTFAPGPARQIAKALAQKFARLDAPNAQKYADRFAAYDKKLADFEAKWKTKFASLPDDKRTAIAYHRSLIYVAKWLGLRFPLELEPKPGVPPTPGHLAKVLKTMKRDGITVVVQEDYYPTRSSETLVKLTKGKLVLLEGGCRFADGDTFIAHLDRNAQQLYAAMGGK